MTCNIICNPTQNETTGVNDKKTNTHTNEHTAQQTQTPSHLLHPSPPSLLQLIALEPQMAPVLLRYRGLNLLRNDSADRRKDPTATKQTELKKKMLVLIVQKTNRKSRTAWRTRSRSNEPTLPGHQGEHDQKHIDCLMHQTGWFRAIASKLPRGDNCDRRSAATD